VPLFDASAGSVHHGAWTLLGRAAAVNLSNGFGENTGRCHVDQIGHGLSEGERGVIHSLDDVTASAMHLANLAAEHDPNVALVVVGHSLGGVVSALIASGSEDKFASAMRSTSRRTR
jgi:pimeloyl-ACP methyl ester carboxylesterase